MDDNEIKALLVQGPELAEKYSTGCFRPTGKCDGVIYLGDVFVSDGFDADGNVTRRKVRQTNENKALRYLRPMDETRRMFEGRTHGMAMPKGFVEFMARKFPEISTAAAELEQPLCALLSCSPRAIDAMQPGNVGKWQAFQVESGVWGVIYVDVQ